MTDFSRLCLVLMWLASSFGSVKSSSHGFAASDGDLLEDLHLPLLKSQLPFFSQAKENRLAARISVDEAGFLDCAHEEGGDDGASSTILEAPLKLSMSLEDPPQTKTYPKSQLLSTGTTIGGVCCWRKARNGVREPFVVLGADTRATSGRMVADKRCEKIHFLATNIWCCGAGTSADLDHITRQCRYVLALRSLQEEESIGNSEKNLARPSSTTASIGSACRFFRDVLYEGQGSMGANLIVGGVSEGLPHIRAIHPHGSMDAHLPYAALGSGGLAAMAVLESRYHEDLSVEEGIELVQQAIKAGIDNDLGSGSQVDLCVIGPDGQSNYTRGVIPEEELEESTLDKIVAPDSSIATGLGVNGFNNNPFKIRSRRQVKQTQSREESNKRDRWNQFLDL